MKLGLEIWLNPIQEVGNELDQNVVAQQYLGPCLGGNVFFYRTDERLNLSECFAVCETSPSLRQSVLYIGTAIDDKKPFRKPRG
ncbi:hypothetical protein KB1_09650 [Cutibacterium modestum]|uniref:Uncharacterized protein n=1 Tax=Cutibacterium modestum TaxID=2559073 RepID=A0AAD1KQ17_9ACTN|nr:hypothetical protein KB1_09650 [Cutibacterium modestum]